MWARSIIGMSKMQTTTRSGPREAEVQRIIILEVDKGKIIDGCIPDIVPVDRLYRDLNEKKVIRVELVMKDAANWFSCSGPDSSEIYSPHLRGTDQSRGSSESGYRGMSWLRTRKGGWSKEAGVRSFGSKCRKTLW